MIEKNSTSRPGMKWDVMDMTDMTYHTGSVDLVIDKVETATDNIVHQIMGSLSLCFFAILQPLPISSTETFHM